MTVWPHLCLEWTDRDYHMSSVSGASVINRRVKFLLKKIDDFSEGVRYPIKIWRIAFGGGI